MENSNVLSQESGKSGCQIRIRQTISRDLQFPLKQRLLVPPKTGIIDTSQSRDLWYPHKQGFMAGKVKVAEYLGIGVFRCTDFAAWGFWCFLILERNTPLSLSLSICLDFVLLTAIIFYNFLMILKTILCWHCELSLYIMNWYVPCFIIGKACSDGSVV